MKQLRRKVYVLMACGLLVIVLNVVLESYLVVSPILSDMLKIIGAGLLVQPPLEYARFKRDSKRYAEIFARVLEEEVANGWPWVDSEDKEARAKPERDTATIRV